MMSKNCERFRTVLSTGCLILKCAFKIDSGRQKYTSQILFEGGFGMLRLDIFRHNNQFSKKLHRLASPASDRNVANFSEKLDF